MTRTHLKIAAAGVALCAGIAGTMAVRAIFNRPGEDALRLMPADGNVVIIEDLVPSPHQVLAFQRIQSALSKTWTQAEAKNAIDAELNDWSLSKSVGKYFGRSLAIEIKYASPFKTLPDSPIPKIEGVGFVSLTDVAAAKIGLQKNLKATPQGYYKLDSGMLARIADGYLQITSDPRWFRKVDAVISGRAKSIVSSPSFQAARTLEDREANIKAYVENTSTKAWGVVSASVEDAGLDVNVRGPAGWAHEPGKAHSPGRIGAQTIEMMPSGAYVLFALAQPGALLRDAAKEMGKRRRAFESAFRGDVVLGLYPSQKPWAGIDVLAMVNSNHGGRPATEFRRLVKELDHQTMHGKPSFGPPQRIGAVRIYRPSAEAQKSIRQMFQNPPPGVNADILLKHKTLAYATEGEKLYIATSVDMLKRALASTEGRAPSIAADLDFAVFPKEAKEGSQVLLGIDPQRIIAGILNTASKGNEDAAEIADSVRIGTSGNHILNLSVGADRQGRVNGRLFVPINYARLAKLIESQQN